MSTLDLERTFGKKESIGVTFDGGGEVLDAGVVADVYVPYACRIQQVTIEADAIGDLVIDVLKTPFSNFPPTSADTITGGNPPTLANAQTVKDSTLTGWNTLVEDDSSVGFMIVSANLIKRAVLVLRVTKL